MDRRRVTAADIARVVGVSRTTVGFVLNNTRGQTISPTTRQRVLEAAERMGYRPNNVARALASGRSNLVLLVLPDWPVENGLRQLIEAASRRLGDAGYALVTWTPVGQAMDRPLWDTLHPDVVVGIEAFSVEQVASMRRAGIRHLIPDPDMPIPIGDIPGTTEGALAQVGHLVGLGHRRLAFANDADPRVRALAEARHFAAARRALELQAIIVDTCDVRVGDASAVQAVRRWIDAGVTAVLAYNDAIAAAVVGAAIRTGLRVPEDLAVIGHDDSPLAGLFLPSLTSIRQDAASAGLLLAEAALLAADGSGDARLENVDLRTEVVIRESTGGFAVAPSTDAVEQAPQDEVPA